GRSGPLRPVRRRSVRRSGHLRRHARGEHHRCVEHAVVRGQRHPDPGRATGRGLRAGHRGGSRVDVVTEIGLLGALLGGVLSLLSPCSALLLPSFFAYAFDGAGRLAARTALFYAGLTAVLAPLGAGLGLIGALLTQHRTLITLISGVVLIGLGIMTVVGKGFASKSAQRAANSLTGSGALSVFALGAVYGFAGFCSGPLLGSVLTIAVAGGHP